jgi:large subunit ribosomal protein L15
MKLHELRSPEGTHRNRKRVGRGTASGHGHTAGRGIKGQLSRSGGGKEPYFEGGQLPLSRRLPHKSGFTNLSKVQYSLVNLDRLAEFRQGSSVDPEAMAKAGLIKSSKGLVKVLGRGELKHALTIAAHKFSASAKQKIEAAGGKAVELKLE